MKKFIKQKQPSKRDSLYSASQWKLIWWKFCKHKTARISGFIVLLFLLFALFAGFLAPGDPNKTNQNLTYAPIQSVRLFKDGSLFLHVRDYNVSIEPKAMRRVYSESATDVVALGFFVKGPNYRLFGLFESNTHLFGPKNPEQQVFLLGTDRLGRDVLTRTLYGSQICLSIGLVGVLLSLCIGVVLGGISGYYGNYVDTIIQRTIEFLRSIPTIQLWMALAAALPLNWPPLRVYFFITIILSLISWTGMARVVRGRFMQLREEDFVMAASLDGASKKHIMFKHMLPAFYSHIIATITLDIPNMILAETALSFLGLGLRAPIVSWGVLLQEAQSLRVVASAPWLLIPGIAVIIAVLSLNFLGDGLRDAADPYN